MREMKNKEEGGRRKEEVRPISLLLLALSFRLPSSAFLLGCALAAGAALAQPYPTKPIRVVVTFTPGSASDILARLIGPKLHESWGQQVVVDNRPSAGGLVAGSIVATSTPDGHTLMLVSSGFAGSAALYDKLPYDTVRDFAGVTQVASTPLLLVVSPALALKSAKDLIALAREKPGQVNFGSSGIGSGTHYAGELFKLTAGINVVHVPYKGTPEALTDTIAGRIQYFLSPVLAATPLVRNGRLQALAVTTRDRMASLPDVPTIAESALPGFEYDGWYGLVAPARTPRPVVNALSKEVGRILGLPDVKDKISAQGATAKPTTPDQFDKLVREEIKTRSKVFKAAGTKPE
jgi:tripartite-type tricarboxylate transporter receptor subunit TctC